MKKTATKPDPFDHAAVARTVSSDLDNLLGPAPAPPPQPSPEVEPLALRPSPEAGRMGLGIADKQVGAELRAERAPIDLPPAAAPAANRDLPRITAIFIAGFIGLAAGYALSHAQHPQPAQAQTAPQDARG